MAERKLTGRERFYAQLGERVAERDAQPAKTPPAPLAAAADGAAIQARCQRCGAQMPTDSIFCAECGWSAPTPRYNGRHRTVPAAAKPPEVTGVAPPVEAAPVDSTRATAPEFTAGVPPE